jgi:hypothetical protein
MDKGKPADFLSTRTNRELFTLALDSRVLFLLKEIHKEIEREVIPLVQCLGAGTVNLIP